MKVFRWIAAVAVCASIGVAGPALASSSSRVHPAWTSSDISASGMVAEANCSPAPGSQPGLTATFINKTNTIWFGEYRITVNGTLRYSGEEYVTAGGVVGLSATLTDGAHSYTTASIKFTPDTGQSPQVQQIKVDLPDNKTCS